MHPTYLRCQQYTPSKGNDKMSLQPLFPFTSIVGQEDMKKALILNVIDPGIGGVLIKGEKGTAKSTAVRSLAGVLPQRDVVSGCIFGCDPSRLDRACSQCTEIKEHKSEKVPMRVVELPLSATEDRVAGTLDIEYALKEGKKRFEPGILAQANGNILYVDEVNLLDDHLVDLLLDSAAMGMNYVEREGISFHHPARFILVGTMNPEEGDLRPQLLDRFGLSVDIFSETGPEDKMRIIKRRMQFDRDPEGYIKECEKESSSLRKDIDSARIALNTVIIGEDMFEAIVGLTSHFGITGHRADITLMKAAKANASFCKRKNVTKMDIADVAGLVLPHRMKRRPFEEKGLNREELEKCLEIL